MTTTVPTDAAEPDAGPSPRRRHRVVIVVVAAVVVTAAAGVAASRSEPRDRVVVEGAAPAFDLPRVGADRERVRLADFAGRPLVVNFWASWCVPCRKEMPALQAVAEQLDGRVGFVGVNHQDGAGPAAAFEREAGVRYPSGYDPDGAVARDFGVLGLPTTVFVDASGRVVARRLGEITENELLDLIAEAFAVEANGTPS